MTPGRFAPFRWFPIVAIPIVAVSAGWVSWLAITEPGVELASPAVFQDVLVGVPTATNIVIRNTHPWKPLSISSVRSSCGCLSIEDMPLTISPGENATIPAVIELDPYEEKSASTIDLYTKSQKPLGLHFTVTAAPPFPGWPTMALAERVGSGLVLKPDPRYAPHIAAVSVGAPGAALQAIPFDPDKHGFPMPSDPINAKLTVELLVEFGTESSPSLWNTYLSWDVADTASRTEEPLSAADHEQGE